MGTNRFSGRILPFDASELKNWVRDIQHEVFFSATSATITYFCSLKTIVAAKIFTSSSTSGSWTSDKVAPASPEEIMVASYLIISAAFDDFVPDGNTTVPRKLHHFIDEVKDGMGLQRMPH